MCAASSSFNRCLNSAAPARVVAKRRTSKCSRSSSATGCRSIYGGNLPTTPWAKNADGRGPAWSNSLFEDNAEFGLGYRLAIDKQTEFARELLLRLAGSVGDELVAAL